MNEPIENLLSNMEHLSRPVSSTNQFRVRAKDSMTGRNINRKSGNLAINTLRAIKKGRAMTAHNPRGMYNKQRIAQSAYNFQNPNKQFQVNTNAQTMSDIQNSQTYGNINGAQPHTI